MYQAYKWSVAAIKELTPDSPPKVIIDTLSQASKACVLKREFSKANVLTRQAVHLARETFGDSHPKYADTLLDYGFYLLSSDSMKDAVTVYEVISIHGLIFVLIIFYVYYFHLKKYSIIITL